MSGFELVLQTQQRVKARLKIQEMKPATLEMVVRALADRARLGWFDPLEEYEPYVSMEEWRYLVLSEYESRQTNDDEKGREGSW